MSNSHTFSGQTHIIEEDDVQGIALLVQGDDTLTYTVSGATGKSGSYSSVADINGTSTFSLNTVLYLFDISKYDRIKITLSATSTATVKYKTRKVI